MYIVKSIKVLHPSPCAQKDLVSPSIHQVIKTKLVLVVIV